MGVKPVVLRRHPLRWRKLPVHVKTALVGAVQRMTRIREEIELCAQVDTMPPIEIVDVCWFITSSDGVPEGFVHGRTTALKHGALSIFGAQICAPTVLYADDESLRGILLHEFRTRST